MENSQGLVQGRFLPDHNTHHWKQRENCSRQNQKNRAAKMFNYLENYFPYLNVEKNQITNAKKNVLLLSQKIFSFIGRVRMESAQSYSP